MRVAYLLFGISLLFQSLSAQVTMEKKVNLPVPALEEISGMIFFNDKLYGHEDGGNNAVLLEIDSTTGQVVKTITIGGATNVDWEDITQDETYIYIGDFGNNANGSRKDLKFYRVPKASIAAVNAATGTTPPNETEIIYFSYEDQNTFCPADFTCESYNTAFDCESVICENGVLHLFTKDWVTSRTVHYVLPAIPGTHIARKKEQLNTDGLLITSAIKINSKVIALTGYNNPFTGTLPERLNKRCSLWLIMGFTDMNNIFGTTTQIQKFDLGKLFSIPQSSNDRGQLEAIVAVNATRVFVAGERMLNTTYSIDIPAQLFGIELGGVIPQEMILNEGISNFTSQALDNAVMLSWDYKIPGASFFEVQVSTTGHDEDFKTIGKVNASNNLSNSYDFSDNSIASSGTVYYRIKATMLNGNTLFSKILFIKNNGAIALNLSAFPSPFVNSLTVNFNTIIKQQLQISIIDVYGHSVLKRNIQASPGNYNLLFDGLQHLSKGVYFLSCRAGDNLVVKKIIKQ
ncbi:MAG: T9SS type A sorting domain-containing protein [Agriterribacter sp.]